MIIAIIKRATEKSSMCVFFHFELIFWVKTSSVIYVKTVQCSNIILMLFLELSINVSLFSILSQVFSMLPVLSSIIIGTRFIQKPPRNYSMQKNKFFQRMICLLRSINPQEFLHKYTKRIFFGFVWNVAKSKPSLQSLNLLFFLDYI